MTTQPPLPEVLEQRLARIEALLLTHNAPDRLVSVEEACAILSVNRSTLWRMEKDGAIVADNRYGKHFALSMLMAYITRDTASTSVVEYGATRKRG